MTLSIKVSKSPEDTLANRYQKHADKNSNDEKNQQYQHGRGEDGA